MDKARKTYVPLIKKACEEISNRLGYDSTESKTD
jgi:hypothetical protein